ncbi:MAG TPA: hypothetical protein VF699_12060, partial [Caulobacteraceae bacterium]
MRLEPDVRERLEAMADELSDLLGLGGSANTFSFKATMVAGYDGADEILIDADGYGLALLAGKCLSVASGEPGDGEHAHLGLN